MAAPLLVLDFDGVVVDALTECALVTWLGVHPPDPRRPVSANTAAMPPAFVERFGLVRAYSRILDHFLVAHRPAAGRMRTPADFDRIFASLPGQYVAGFVAAATAARRRCRTEEPDVWLDLHTIYPGMPGLLARHAGAVAVVTAKDAGSVQAILGRHGLDGAVLEIIGESRDKAAAVRALTARHGTAPDRVTFVDDNLANVRQVAATGADAYWATWGYHTPADRAEARRLRVRPLMLAAVPALTTH